ncbi:MAG: alkaline phosphatase, partial [Rhodothermales bacterium]
WHERIWRLIAEYNFPLFLLTGDNVYIDDPTRPGVQDYTYYRRQSRPEFRELTAGTSIAAIWDDHEFGDNDSWGGPEIDQPEWKLPVWRVFKNNWNNPSYAGGEAQPGCWFSFSIADVEIFMLDDRYYRDNHQEPPTDRPATMLGPDQKAWLFEEISKSTATFKMLVTSVPWAYGVKPGSSDPWQGFKEEREEIFSFLSDNKINGVFLLSGDRHRADIWKIERPDGYPMYDFENARLTNLHTHDVIPGAIYGYNEKCTFGRLRFDTAKADPEVIYDIITIDNEVVYSFPLRLSEISHG